MLPFVGWTQDYELSTDNTAYRDLTGGVFVSDDFDEVSYDVPLKEKFPDLWDFRFFDIKMDMDSIFIGGPGFVLIESWDAKHIVALDPFFYGNLFKHDVESSISYGMDEVDGVSYFVVQWKNLESDEVLGKSISVQLRIQEETNNVSFHYGESDIPEGTASPEGIQCGAFLLDEEFKLVKMFTISGQPKNPTGRQGVFDYLKAYPDNGTQYMLENKTFSDVAPNELENKMATLYPNPTSGDLIISLDKTYSTVSLQITSILGEVLMETEYQNVNQVEAQLLAKPGLYYVEIVADEVRIPAYKVIKE